MTAELGPQAAPGEWQQALDDLERGLQEAARAAAALRRSLAVVAPVEAAMDPKVRELPLPPRPKPEEGGFEPLAQEPQVAADGSVAFERVWARLEAEKLGKAGGLPAKEGEDAAARVTSRLSSLPGQVIITVEDRESKVDLVPLHRAFTGLPGVEDASLVSFANGVPVISLRVAGELDHGQLSNAVAMATDRECEVIPHENGKLFLRLTPHADEAS